MNLTRCLMVAALCAFPAIVGAQPIEELEREVDSFDARIEKLEQRYLKPAVLASKYKLEARYNDARVAYFTQDYARASVLLVDVVRDEKFKGLRSYREALFLLGDSLFELRNYVAARRYFEEVFTLGNGPFYEEAAARLLEIAFLTKNFERLDQIYAQLSGAPMSAAISYLSGKAFYEKEDYARARENFARAASNPEYRLMAEYFRAVTFAAEGSLTDARQIFETITRTASPANAREREILDLAWLALGRIAYEDGDVEHAIDFYNHVQKDSPHYDRMLWELTWVLVSRGNYEEARRNVDIIHFLEDPDPDIAAESQLLRADLSLRLDEYDAARADYTAVYDKFAPVSEQMNEFVTRHDDLPSFFSTMVQEEVSGVETNIIPPLVEAWINHDPDMRAASQLLADVRHTDSEIRQSYRMLDEIAARLNSSTRVQAFPELAEGMALGVDAEARLVELRQKLLDAQFAAVSGSMTPADRAQWDALLEDISVLRERFEAMPARREEQAKREAMVTDEHERLQRRIDQAGYDIVALRAQLNAMNTYLENDLAQEAAAENRADIEAARAELKGTLTALETTKEQLEAELAQMRREAGAGDAVMEAERALRDEYRAKLDDARQFLARFGGAPEVGRVLQKFGPIEKRLDTFFLRMNQLVDERVDELRQDINVERALMNDHRQSMEELVTASQSGAGVLAYLNFMKAQQQFNEIVLRSDVGVIDVVWEKKEDMTTKIEKLFEERTSELRLLQEAFEEVR